MKLKKRQLQAALDALTKAHNLAAVARAKIFDHCAVVYGVDPADVDNDSFIDGCDGGGGMAAGMSAEAFDASMRECMAMAEIEMPNAM
jgi:hypothetical protein